VQLLKLLRDGDAGAGLGAECLSGEEEGCGERAVRGHSRGTRVDWDPERLFVPDLTAGWREALARQSARAGMSDARRERAGRKVGEDSVRDIRGWGACSDTPAPRDGSDSRASLGRALRAVARCSTRAERIELFLLRGAGALHRFLIAER
jgi:hypothetical protein